MTAKTRTMMLAEWEVAEQFEAGVAELEKQLDREKEPRRMPKGGGR